MTSSARDLRYGRRGGAWADTETGRLAADVSHALDRWRADGGQMPDRSRLFHPETIATTRAHQRATAGACPAKTDRAEPCACRPDPDDLAEVWAGRARMARARKAAGAPLDDIDREALAQ